MELLKTDLVREDPPVLRLAGEIDISTADQFRTALEDALSVDRAVVVDMAGVTFFDASGIRVVLQIAQSLNGGRPLTLLNAGRVAWLLELVGLSELPSIELRDGGERRGR